MTFRCYRRQNNSSNAARGQFYIMIMLNRIELTVVFDRKQDRTNCLLYRLGHKTDTVLQFMFLRHISLEYSEVYTTRCTTVQSAVLRLHVVRLSVRLSVRL